MQKGHTKQVDHTLTLHGWNFSGTSEKSPTKSIARSDFHYYRRKLLVFELEGVLLYSTFFPGMHEQPARRGWLTEFMALCLENFDVGIWTSVTYERTKQVLDATFSREERLQFKFVKCGTDAITAYKRRTRNSATEVPILLKMLEDIWSQFPDYDQSNTLLIDTRTYHAFGNPSCTSLFTPIYKYPDNDDFLITYLWPCLVNLIYACHTRIFIQECAPRWSIEQSTRHYLKYKDIYAELKRHHSSFLYGRHIEKPQFSMLEWSEFELSWDTKEYVCNIFSSKIGPNVDELSNKQIVDAAFDLGFDYDRTFIKDPKGFLKAFVRIMETTNKFRNVFPKDKCTADDDDHLGVSCSNRFCTVKHGWKKSWE